MAARPVLISMTCLIAIAQVHTVTAQDPDSQAANITQGVESQLKNPGESAELTCTVVNKGNHKFYWEQNFNNGWVLISNDETVVATNPVGGTFPNNKTKYSVDKNVENDLSLTFALTINRLGPLDTGIYRCSLVSLDGGIDVSSSGRLSLSGVADGPKIVNIIGKVIEKVNETATLKCLVADKGNNKVKWKRTKDNLVISSDRNIETQNPSTDGIPKYEMEVTNHNSGYQFELTINRLTAEDSGYYECFVQTSAPPYPSQSGEIVAGLSPTLSTTSQLNTTLQIGGSVTLFCSVTGTPTPVIIWQRIDGRILPIGEQTYRGPSLQVPNVKKDLRGLYKCLATNGLYPDDELVFRVFVLFPPAVNPLQRTVLQAVSYPAILECFFEGFPTVSTTWYKLNGNNRAPVTDGENYEIQNVVGDGQNGRLGDKRFSLRIYRVSKENYGEFECEGISNGQTVSAAIVLQESETCVGGSCPIGHPTQQPSKPTESTKCTGSSCTGSGSRENPFGLLTSLSLLLALIF